MPLLNEVGHIKKGNKPMELEEIKQYLRITHNQDDVYLMDLIDTSKNFIKEQTGITYSDNDLTYKQAVKFMVAYFYDNRTPITEKAVNSVPYTLDSIITHIGMRGALINE